MSTTSTTESKRIIGKVPARFANAIPEEILNDPRLAQALSHLPSNYEFEIHKSIWRLRQCKATLCALQFPEGLLMYASIIANILRDFAGCESVIMGDVTYGACCVDDYTAKALGADFFIHYGHSCLVPINVTDMNMLYVFVDIKIDISHFVQCITDNFPPTTRLLLSSTIQFASSLQSAKVILSDTYSSITIPQAKPLSKGEVLGCTSPVLESGEYDVLVFLADGRFHLESIMIQNPHIPEFYKYDPYSKKITVEKYKHNEMHELRKEAIAKASTAQHWGIVLGTLGRQGSANVLSRIEKLFIDRNINYEIICLSEIFPDKLAKFKDIDAWTQIACPRLSIDWGYAFPKPLLSAYETEVALKEQLWMDPYPMDYYRLNGGKWSNYAHKEKKVTSDATKNAIARLRLQRKRRPKVVVAFDE